MAKSKKERAVGPNAGRRKLVAEISRQTGVEAADVTKVLKVLGIGRRHFDEAVQVLGGAPRIDDIRLAYKISSSMVAV